MQNKLQVGGSGSCNISWGSFCKYLGEKMVVWYVVKLMEMKKGGKIKKMFQREIGFVDGIKLRSKGKKVLRMKEFQDFEL